ncbi:Hypothetical predicted protein [Octopus vulgaris]|uniref:Uncharacterized protein n=1 Tax=Octopus vulgaris TaxID=6645 RepID=A0AA36AQQ6_OCTVU|nr:Hypothetical predicted protein [Octopus vulgaris]
MNMFSDIYEEQLGQRNSEEKEERKRKERLENRTFIPLNSQMRQLKRDLRVTVESLRDKSTYHKRKN